MYFWYGCVTTPICTFKTTWLLYFGRPNEWLCIPSLINAFDWMSLCNIQTMMNFLLFLKVRLEGFLFSTFHNIFVNVLYMLNIVWSFYKTWLSIDFWQMIRKNFVVTDKTLVTQWYDSLILIGWRSECIYMYHWWPNSLKWNVSLNSILIHDVLKFPPIKVSSLSVIH